MKNKKENLKDMNEADLTKKLDILRENARVIRFKAEGSRSKNVKELATIRKDVARILTAINTNKK